MSVELVGTRIVAPYMGSSITVWTSIICVILASLSLGYYVGGILADRYPNTRILTTVICIASASIALTAFGKEPMLRAVSTHITDIRLSSLLASGILFSIPSIVLGMVQPIVVRVCLQTIRSSGEAIGRLSMIATVGSIVGTISTGYFLLSALGNTDILFFLSIVLWCTSLLLPPITWKNISVILIILLTYFVGDIRGGNTIIDVDTQYGRVRIYDRTHADTGLPVKVMQIDKSIMSEMFLDDHDLTSDVYKFFRLVDFFVPEIKRALVLGGAGYSYPKDFLKHHPASTIDVVEIDPMVTKLARDHFFLTDSPNLTIYHEDARTFLQKNQNTYDAIVVDVFHPSGSLPYHLTTYEAVGQMHKALSDGGVIIVNIVSPVVGKFGKFTRAEYATYTKVFPQVFMFTLPEERNPRVVRHSMIVALNTDKQFTLTSKEEEHDRFLKKKFTQYIAPEPMLTDDFAPVDQYMNGL